MASAKEDYDTVLTVMMSLMMIITKTLTKKMLPQFLVEGNRSPLNLGGLDRGQ
jgi:hypothetical protein